MHKKLTITLDEQVYHGLYATIGRRKISQFLEDLARPHVVGKNLDRSYQEMAEDQEREKEALEWCNALIGDIADETM